MAQPQGEHSFCQSHLQGARTDLKSAFAKRIPRPSRSLGVFSPVAQRSQGIWAGRVIFDAFVRLLWEKFAFVLLRSW